MPFSLGSAVYLLFLTTLLTLPEPGLPQCYRPSLRNPGFVAPSCCTEVSKNKFRDTVTSCYEHRETTFPECNKHAFIFITQSNKEYCVDPASTWLKRRFQILQKRGICCQML